MTGQMCLSDFLPKEKPSMNEPGLYSRSGRQRLTITKNGEQIEVSTITDNEMMIIKVNADEFKEYIRGIC